MIKTDKLFLPYRLFVWKDTREATTTKQVKIIPEMNEDDMFANLENLLNSGDTSAALMVLDMFTSNLNSDDTVSFNCENLNSDV